MKTPIILSLLIATFAVFFHALPLQAELRFESTDGAATQYLLQYQEGDRFFVDLFNQAEDGFQDRIRHDSFSTEAASQNHFESLKARLSRKSPSAFRAKSPYRAIQLWPVTQAWSEAWEDKYTEWMKENLTETFLSDHGIATDCADVAVTYRWIFARLHGLPAGNTLSGSGTLFTQDSAPNSWASLPTHVNWWQDQRFLRAITYIQDNTYTGSLFDDLYPVKINDRAVNAGALWVINEQHTYNVGKPDFASETWMPLYSSTVPREVRELFIDVFNESQPEPGVDGFQRPRWIQKVQGRWTMIKAEKMPWYSLEQYSPDFVEDPDQFAEKVYERLSGQSLEHKRWLKGLAEALANKFDQRSSVVRFGFETCYPDKCAEGTEMYDAHSTPSRDRHIFQSITAIEQFIQSHPGQGLEAFWQNWEKNTTLMIWSYHWVELPLGELIRIWKMGAYSSDPNHDAYRRWGLQPGGPGSGFKVRLDELTSRISTRIITIRWGQRYCVEWSSSYDCSVGSTIYEAYQTFEMDRLIIFLDQQIQADVAGDESLVPYWRAFQARMVELQGQNFPMERLLENFRSGNFSSDPRQSWQVRWGLSTAP